MPWKPSHPGEYPTLGYYVLDWWAEYLLSPDRPGQDDPFVATREQAELVLRFYRLDPVTGKRVVRRGVVCRPRGWGKSPLVAGFCLVEALGDVVFDGWDAQGRPVGRPWWTERTPNVHVTATTDDQTEFTWRPMQQMISDHLIDEYPGLEPLGTFIATPYDGKIQQLTSSATSNKGGTPVFVSMDQTETWVPGKNGPAFHKMLLSNLTKTGGTCLETPNAYTPGDGSVAESTFNAWRAQVEGRSMLDRGLLFDHREAPADTDMYDRDSLIEGLRVAYGDSSADPRGCVLHDPPCEPGWADLDDRVSRAWDADADEQQIRADFLNQVTHSSDAWLSQPEWRARKSDVSLTSGDVITLGFDGSRGRVRGKPDATALIACRVVDGHVFELGSGSVWEAPDVKSAWAGWVPPIPEIEAAIEDAFTRFQVAGFYADPAGGWDGHVARWEATYASRMVKTGRVVASRDKPFSWWMNRPGLVERAVQQLEGAVRNGDMTHDGSWALTRHVLNARRRLVKGKLSLWKESDASTRKIDAAIAAVLAWQARLDAVAAGAGAPAPAPTFYVPERIY